MTWWQAAAGQRNRYAIGSCSIRSHAQILDSQEAGTEPHETHSEAKRARRRRALVVSLAYAALGWAWISTSDQFIALLTSDPDRLSALQTYKGWLFVFVTAAMLYGAVVRGVRPEPYIPPTRDHRHLRWAIIAGCSLLATLLVVDVAYTVWIDRRDLLSDGHKSSQNLARIIDEHTAERLSIIEAALLGAARTLAQEPRSGIEQVDARDHLLYHTLSVIPYARAVSITDAKGRIRYSTDRSMTRLLDVSDRDHFIAHIHGTGPSLYIGAPIVSRVTGSLIIPMSVRLSGPDGAFMGVMVAAIPPEEFQRAYDQVEMGPDGFISLYLRDGTLIARSPGIPSAIGGKYTRLTVFADGLHRSDTGTYSATSPFDGVDRIVSYQAMQSRSLVVVVGLSKKALLGGWVRRAASVGGVGLVLLATIAWLGMFLDRELKRRFALATALAGSEQRYRAVLQSLHDGIVVRDERGVVVSVNRRVELLLKMPRDSMIGRQSLSPDVGFLSREGTAIDWHKDYVLSTLRDGERRSYSPLRVVRKDGSEFWADASIFPVLGDDDALPHAVVTTLTDITERHVAEQEVLRLNAALEQRVEARTMELREAIKELEAFSYSVSHDLQAPLRHIEGHASLLARELEHPSEQVQKRLVSISRCVRKMGQLLEDMLRLSRTSRANLQLRPIDPAILVQDIIAECTAEEAHRDIRFHVGELPGVIGDEVLLRQLLHNLVRNAVKFTRPVPRPEIQIEARLNAIGMVELSVKDNGVGFDPAHATKLFGVFQRLHSESQFEGTGIGLAIVKRIATRLGGEVRAEGAVGAGATVYVTLRPAGSDRRASA